MNALLGELAGSFAGERHSTQSGYGVGHGAYPFPGNTAAGSPIASPIGEAAQYYVYIVGHGVAETTVRTPRNCEEFAAELLPLTAFRSAANKQQIESDLKSLKKSYIFRNEPLIIQFLSSHRSVPAVLITAIPELKRSFGDDTILHLEVLREDDDTSFLYAIAMWSGTVEKAEHNLENFDDNWWFNQPPRRGLTFTYELI